MNITRLLILGFCFILVACTENQEPVEKESIVDKLPESNREYLLGPLESAMDDIKSIVDKDEAYFSESDTWNEGDVKGSIFYKLSGNDTALARLEISGKGNLKELHSWYYDKNGNLFYSEHEITNVDYGFEQGPSHRNYKFYFEDNGSLLSAYARTSFDGNPLPEEWTAVRMTNEETTYLNGRLTAARKSFAAANKAN